MGAKGIWNAECVVLSVELVQSGAELSKRVVSASTNTPLRHQETSDACRNPPCDKLGHPDEAPTFGDAYLSDRSKISLLKMTGPNA